MSSSIILERRCGICKESFPLTSLFWHNDKKDKQHGFARDCKECAKAKTRKWYDDNTERSKQSAKQWKIDHPEEYRANNLKGAQKRRELTGDALAELKRKNAEYRKRTSEQRNAYNREYRRTHPEWVRLVYKRFHQNHLEARRADSRVRTRLWAKKNPIRVRMNNAKRAARIRGAGGAGFFKADYELQLRSQKGNCWWCGKPMGKDVTIDHVTPIIRGGQHDPRNIVLAHKSCNCSKKEKLPHEWNGRLL